MSGVDEKDFLQDLGFFAVSCSHIVTDEEYASKLCSRSHSFSSVCLNLIGSRTIQFDNAERNAISRRKLRYELRTRVFCGNEVALGCYRSRSICRGLSEDDVRKIVEKYLKDKAAAEEAKLTPKEKKEKELQMSAKWNDGLELSTKNKHFERISAVAINSILLGSAPRPTSTKTSMCLMVTASIFGVLECASTEHCMKSTSLLASSTL